MGRLTRRARPSLSAFLLAAALVTVIAPPALGADDTSVTFGKPEGTSRYGEQIEFTQPVELGAPADRVEVRLTFGDSASPVVQEMPPSGAGSHELRYTFDFTEGGHLYPNTRITAQWRVYQGADDETESQCDSPTGAMDERSLLERQLNLIPSNERIHIRGRIRAGRGQGGKAAPPSSASRRVCVSALTRACSFGVA